MKTVFKSKITIKQCGNCRHWKSLSRVKDDPRGYCHQGSEVKSMGRFSPGCDIAFLLPHAPFNVDAFPHYIPVILASENDAESTEQPPSENKN